MASQRPDLSQVVAILTEIAGPDRTPDPVTADTPINEGGFWLDSADLLEVLLACEAAFAVDLDPAAMLDGGSMLTVSTLLRAIDAARRS